jgi:hypothetical protein
MTGTDRGGGQGTGPGRTTIGRLCAACVRRTGVDGGGVSVFSSRGTPVLVHATDAVARTIQDLQFTLGEGPSVDAASSGSPVLVSDLADVGNEASRRWPAFLVEARSVEASAVFAFPLRVGDVPLGTVDLYRRTPGDLTPGQLAAGLTTVESVGESLLAPDTTADGEAVAVASESYPLTVHRAAGMVMVQLGTGIEEALVRLRAAAFLEGALVTSVAAEVLDGRRRFSKEAP